MADLAEKRPADDAAEERRKKRKSRWGGEEEKADQGVITALPSSLTKDQQDAYLRMFVVVIPCCSCSCGHRFFWGGLALALPGALIGVECFACKD